MIRSTGELAVCLIFSKVFHHPAVENKSTEGKNGCQKGFDQPGEIPAQDRLCFQGEELECNEEDAMGPAQYFYRFRHAGKILQGHGDKNKNQE